MISEFIVNLDGGSVMKTTGEKPKLSPEGRLWFTFIYKNGKGRIFHVHEIVASKLKLDLINKDVNHIDGNKLNNHPSNIECITRQENLKHQTNNKLYVPLV